MVDLPADLQLQIRGEPPLQSFEFGGALASDIFFQSAFISANPFGDKALSEPVQWALEKRLPISANKQGEIKDAAKIKIMSKHILL